MKCKCYECLYAGRKGNTNEFFCNGGDSDNYGKPINSESGCEDGETEIDNVK